jgi:hypothetical protein
MGTMIPSSGGALNAPPAGRSLELRVRALTDGTIGDLKVAWADAWGKPPPKGARRRLLMLGIAWKWQADVSGGLSKTLQRRLAVLEATSLQNGTVSEAVAEVVRRQKLIPGTQLIRIWKGDRHEVQVTETGYLWRGRSWASLSVIAREITGARRNGPAFFGLRDGPSR